MCVCVCVCVCVVCIFLLYVCMHAFVYNAAFEDTLKHPDLSIEMALATIRLTTQNDRFMYPTMCLKFALLLTLLLWLDMI